jgi:hypothetical protein
MSQISRKICPFRDRKPPGHQIDMTKTKLLHSILLLKQLAQRTKQRVLRSVKEKKQTTYKDEPIKITADFLTETLKAARA